MTLETRATASPLMRRLRKLSAAERVEEAVDFLQRYHRELGMPPDDEARRIRQVKQDLRRHGYYEHTFKELEYGAAMAWRNHARCIGRLHWKSLHVFDRRTVNHPDDIAAEVYRHADFSRGDGRIRSAISIFAPARAHDLPTYIENEQVYQYAGYVDDEGNKLGDYKNVDFTRIAISLGWRAPKERGPFDLLPLILRGADGRRRVYEPPNSDIGEVLISHPEFAALGTLGLRWYPVPLVSNMILTIGGIDYPCAPFNGFYMGTEIASRDLVDVNRYDLLERVAKATISGAMTAQGLWQDRALVVLNEAVLHSFNAAGVTIIDHHAASAQYIEFEQREKAMGRTPSGNWAWIVPPQASSACPVFHLPMQDLDLVPNFYRNRQTDGDALAIGHHDELWGKARRRWERAKRKYRDWRRFRD